MSLKYDIFVVKLKSTELYQHLTNNYSGIFTNVTDKMLRWNEWMNADMQDGVAFMMSQEMKTMVEDDAMDEVMRRLNREKPDFVVDYDTITDEKLFNIGITWRQFDNEYCMGMFTMPFDNLINSYYYHVVRLLFRDILFQITDAVLFQNFHGGGGSGNPYVESVSEKATEFKRIQYDIYMDDFSIIPNFPAVAIHKWMEDWGNFKHDFFYMKWDYEFLTPLLNNKNVLKEIKDKIGEVRVELLLDEVVRHSDK